MTETKQRPDTQSEAKKTSATEGAPKISPRDGLADRSERPEQVRVGDGDAKVARSSWENPGTFAVTRDSNGSVQRIEGWIQPDDRARSAADGKLQREVGKTGANPERSDGSHLIAVSLGGPRAEGGDKDKIARANLVPADARMNRSYMSGVEAHLRDYMKENPDKQLYMQVDVRQRGSHNLEVTHRVFERGPEGKVSEHPTKEFVSNVSKQPAETQAKAVRKATGEAGQAFYEPDKKGTVGPVQ